MTSLWPAQRWSKLAPLASTLVASPALPVSAQQLHADDVQAWTTHRLLGNPHSVAGAIHVSLTDRFAVRLGGAWLSSACDGYWPFNDRVRVSRGEIGVVGRNR